MNHCIVGDLTSFSIAPSSGQHLSVFVSLVSEQIPAELFIFTVPELGANKHEDSGPAEQTFATAV